MVHIGNTSHRNERNVVQNPADNRVDTRIMDMVDSSLAKIIIPTLPPDKVDEHHSDEGTERGGGTPVHHRVTEEEVFDDVVVPAAHAETNMKNGPLPVLRCEIVLLIRVRDERVVGGHHGNVQVDKVAEERGLVGANVGRGELVVPVRFDVPVGEYVARVILLGTGDFNLLETPLWEVHITGAEVAAETGVSQTECGGKCAELAVVLAGSIGENLDGPVVFVIANGHVSIARHFVVCLCDRSLDDVGVQVPTSLSVNETNDVAMANKTEVWGLGIIIRIAPSRVEEPVIVGILVMVTSDLLLRRALGIGLNVGVEETTAIPHVLDGNAGADCDFERGFFDLRAFEVGLEERAHLCITGTRVLEDDEVEPEASHINRHWDRDETDDAGNPVLCIGDLLDLKISELVPEIFNRVDSNQRCNEQTNPFHTISSNQRMPEYWL